MNKMDFPSLLLIEKHVAIFFFEVLLRLLTQD